MVDEITSLCANGVRRFAPFPDGLRTLDGRLQTHGY